MGLLEIIILIALIIIIVKFLNRKRSHVTRWRTSLGDSFTVDESAVQNIMNQFKILEKKYEPGRVAFLFENNDTARAFINDFKMTKHSMTRIDDISIVSKAKTLLQSGKGVLVFPDDDYKYYNLYFATWKSRSHI